MNSSVRKSFFIVESPYLVFFRVKGSVALISVSGDVVSVCKRLPGLFLYYAVVSVTGVINPDVLELFYCHPFAGQTSLTTRLDKGSQSVKRSRCRSRTSLSVSSIVLFMVLSLF